MNYQALTLSKNGLPTWDSLINPILHLLAPHQNLTRQQIVDALVDELQLPKNLQMIPVGKRSRQSMIANRVGFALSDMAIGDVLMRPKRGAYALTELGQQMRSEAKILTHADIEQLPLYQQHQAELAKRKAQYDVDNSDEQTLGPEQELQKQVALANSEVETQLLERILDNEPAFFEKMVTQLLAKMGYQGPNGSQEVTPASHDGGIDAIINQDPLGTRTIYIQAKRYRDGNTVQRPAIDAFYGSLSRLHADRGVFITTSTFSKEAKRAAKSMSIVLIDGVRLTKLMLDYQVGVQVRASYTLFEIDEDFFELVD